MGVLDDSDREFIEKFENCGFQKACWSHSAHIRMAWIHLSRSDSFEEGLERIRTGIQRFNAVVSGMGYHETVTVAFSQIIYARMSIAIPGQTWMAFETENADLFQKTPSILENYYSRELLSSGKAKSELVAPDRQDIACPTHPRLPSHKGQKRKLPHVESEL